VGEPPVEVDERRLALRVDRRQVRLDHRHAVGAVQLRDVGPDGVVTSGGVTDRVLRSSGDRRLDHHLAVVGRYGLARRDEPGGDDGDPPGGELAQVALVGVPREHLGGVGHPRSGPRPGHERIAAKRVVPGGANHDEVEVLPREARVVPGGERRIDALVVESDDHRRRVLVAVRQLDAGREGNVGHRTRTLARRR
jgi:hypothetical protein